MDASSKPAGLFGSIETRTSTCDEHGDYTSRGMQFGGKVRWSTCPACADRERAQREAEDAERERAQAAAALAHRIEEGIKQAMIPLRYRDRTFESFRTDTPEQRRVYAAVKGWADDFKGHLKTGSGLLLLGSMGTGKTHLACAALLQAAADHMGLYLTAAQAIRTVRNTWRRDSEMSEQQVMRWIGMDADLLVLDEIGVQYGTDGERNILFDLLDRRYANMRPTILVGNVSPKELRESLGDRVYDRLRETQTSITFAGESQRGRVPA